MTAAKTSTGAKKFLTALRDEQDQQTVIKRDPFEVLWDKKKPLLPEIPDVGDLAGQCSWVTAVLNLDPTRPVIGAEHSGNAGATGHIEIARIEVPALLFEPASKLTNGAKLTDELVWQLQPTDGEPYPWSNAQAVKIARVVRWLCGNARHITANQQTELVLNTFLEMAAMVEGHTHGTAHERYEAALLLRPETNGYGEPHGFRYLVDADSEEVLVRVSDLSSMARKVLGSGLAHGWLDARMERLGWSRRRLEGWALHQGPGRGHHAKTDVYGGLVSR